MEQAAIQGQAADGARDKALRALVTAETFLHAAQREIPGIAAQIRAGEHEELLPSLKLLFDGLQSLAQLAADLDAISGGTGNAVSALDLPGMRQQLEVLVGMQEARDWDRLAEIVEGGLGPRIHPWQEHFRAQLDALRLS